jgi:hypothetical protein
MLWRHRLTVHHVTASFQIADAAKLNLIFCGATFTHKSNAATFNVHFWGIPQIAVAKVDHVELFAFQSRLPK